MTDATMFHMLEPVLMDLYNAKNRAESEEKKKQIQKWIDTLQGEPTLKEFEEIMNKLKDLK